MGSGQQNAHSLLVLVLFFFSMLGWGGLEAVIAMSDAME